MLDNYNWDLFSPISESGPTAPGTFWDPAFKAKLNSVCNVSYATMVLYGPRKTKEWRESMNSKYAPVGNRGVQMGAMDKETYDSSITLKIHGSKKQWAGNVCFNDNHMEYTNSFFPEGVFYLDAGESVPDSLFNLDCAGGTCTIDSGDCFLIVMDTFIPAQGDPFMATDQWFD